MWGWYPICSQTEDGWRNRKAPTLATQAKSAPVSPLTTFPFSLVLLSFLLDNFIGSLRESTQKSMGNPKINWSVSISLDLQICGASCPSFDDQIDDAGDVDELAMAFVQEPIDCWGNCDFHFVGGEILTQFSTFCFK